MQKMETKLKEKFQSIQKSIDELAQARTASLSPPDQPKESENSNQEKIIQLEKRVEELATSRGGTTDAQEAGPPAVSKEQLAELEKKLEGSVSKDAIADIKKKLKEKADKADVKSLEAKLEKGLLAVSQSENVAAKVEKVMEEEAPKKAAAPTSFDLPDDFKEQVEDMKEL